MHNKIMKISISKSNANKYQVRFYRLHNMKIYRPININLIRLLSIILYEKGYKSFPNHTRFGITLDYNMRKDK